MATRVRYREGQTIGVADLRGEQDYLLAVGRRHNVTLHEWGIVTGLRVGVDPQGIRVDRGFAIDGFGRELILRTRLLVAWGTPAGAELRTYGDWVGGAAAGEKQGGIGVWLQYGLQPDSGADRRALCGAGRHARWAEEPRLVFTPWVPSEPRTRPPGIDVDEPPWMREVASDRDDPPWPVLLAWLKREGDRYVVDADQCLPYARLVAQAIESCSTTTPPESPDAPNPIPPAPVVSTRIDLARNMGANRRLFAVRTADRAGVARDRLRIEDQGAAEFAGSLTFAPAGVDAPSDLALVDSEFAPEDVKDPHGLLCFLRADTPAARKLAADFRRALDMRLQDVGVMSEGAQRAVLAAALNRVVARRADNFGRTLERNGRFEPPLLGGVVLRRDTWAVVNRISGQTAAPIPQMTLLIVADGLSPYVEIPKALRDGGFALELRSQPLPTAAQPWSVYRTDVAKDGAATRQLRIEIGAPPADVALDRQRLAIGHFSSPQTFKPCLTVDAAATVTVSGTLKVEGRLIEAPVAPDPSDPRFVSEVVKAWVGGTVGGIAAASPITIDIDLIEAKTGTKWPYIATLVNTGQDGVDDVKVFESLGINEQIVLPRPIGAFDSIGGGESKTINVSHDMLTATAGQITVAIGAIGRGSSLGLVVAVKLKTVSIVS